jgi:single-strand DNA-binding protein
MSQTMTVIGNVAGDPEIRFTQSGKAVVSFTVLTSKSKKDESTGQWESTDTTGWTVKAWDQLAQNCADTLVKGDAVIVYGTAVWRSWEKEDGTKGGRMEVTAWNVGPDLKRYPASIARIKRTVQESTAPPMEDPWSLPASVNAVEEPPF